MSNKDKILEISKKLGLSHIGSCLSVLPILEEIYAKKKPGDKVILDNSHAHLAHLVVRAEEDLKIYDAHLPIEDFIEEYGIHCDCRAGCDASGGSLGHGIGIGIGMALAGNTVHVTVSDGSMMEGSNWEALRIANSLYLHNLLIYCNFNGFSAVAEVSSEDLERKMREFYPHLIFKHTDNTKGFEGIQGHYKIII